MAPGLTNSRPPTPQFGGSDTGTSEMSDDGRSTMEPIAVVGLSLKFPQEATTPEAFWNMIMQKRCAMTEVPHDRFNVNAFHQTGSDENDVITPRGGHFIKEDLTRFDAPFFSITSAEAASMDIQQRKLLECVYHALENAGIPIEQVNGSNTSVHTGSFADDYRLITMRDHESLPKYAATGSSISILANRISWFYNLHGSSVQLDTACSSSLVALDMACQGLRTKEADMGIVAGSNTIFTMDTFLILSNMNFLSPDSRCYSFDHRGNGYARGEGFGVLVLKRLSDAVHDGDTIRAVIRSTGSNSDGRTPGIAQPSKAAQEKLIRDTYARAGLSRAATRFFEAHGTGTAVGDPIEANAIGAAFGEFRSPEEPLYVGALKSNLGHLEGASGVAGVIKAVLSLEKGVIPPNTNFEKLNPRIDAASLNLAFPTEAIPWPSSSLRRASVNSFGFGGSNAHVILDDAYNYLLHHHPAGFHCTVKAPPTVNELALPRQLSVEDRQDGQGGEAISAADINPSLLVWSAADEGGIKRLTNKYNEYFASLSLSTDQRQSYIHDLAYTLSSRRSILPWKSFAVGCPGTAGAPRTLTLSKAVRSSRTLGLGYIFTGQGAQFAGMGRELLVYPVFRSTLHRAQLYLCEAGCPWSLMDEMFQNKATSRIDCPDRSQPLCTALQIALVHLLRSFNIVPQAVMGHSSGEIAAAYCVGGLSFRSACKVAYLRGKLAAKLASSASRKGAMLAVGLSQSKAEVYIKKVKEITPEGTIVVACINSPNNVTISGDEVQISLLAGLLNKESIFARKLKVDVGYHSPQMESVAADYMREMGQLELGQSLPGCSLMQSSVTAAPVKNILELCDSSYWIRNLVSPVRFSEALSSLLTGDKKEGRKRLGAHKDARSTNAVPLYNMVELGPHNALAGPVKDITITLPCEKEITYASCLKRNFSAFETTLEMAGQLWCLGYPVDIAKANQFQMMKRVARMALPDLPAYPFDHSQSYWHESRISKDYRLREHPRLEMLGTRAKDWNPLEARWRKFTRISESPWVADHVVNGSTIYPAAGMLVMAIEGARQLVEKSNEQSRSVKAYKVIEAVFQRALVIDTEAENGTESQLYMRPVQEAAGKEVSQFEFRVYSYEGKQWGENCRGSLAVEFDGNECNDVDVHSGTEEYQAQQRLLSQRKKNCTQMANVSTVYDHFDAMGLRFGPAFQTLQEVMFNQDGEVVAKANVSGESTSHTPPSCLIHPTALDAFIQVILSGLTRGGTCKIPATVPTRVTDLWLSATMNCAEMTSLVVTSCQLSRGARQTESSFAAFDMHGTVQVSVKALETTNVDRQDVRNANEDGPVRPLCYHMEWKPDIDQLTSAKGQAYFGDAKPVDAEKTAFYQDLACFLHATIRKTLQNLDQDKTDPAGTHYVAWMRLQEQRFHDKSLLHMQPDWESKMTNYSYQETLARRLETYSSEGKFYVEVAQHLLPILQGKMDPLQVLFSGDLVKDYYLEINARLSGVFYRVIDLLAHKNPNLKALEIGAGTGGTTTHILKPLFPQKPRCARFDFTDISPTFFEKARENFKPYALRMHYGILDIERNPLNQGFELGTYDLIVAANVLHATKDLDVTLRNVHTLLKTGGKLVLLEQTGDFARGGFAFGLLPGWWLSEDTHRSWGPTMTPTKWDSVLANNGFSGTDFVLHDYDGEKCQELSIIVSTAQELERETMTTTLGVSLVTQRGSTTQAEVAKELQRHISAKFQVDCSIDFLEDEEETISHHRFSVFLVDIDGSVLHTMNEDNFGRIRKRLVHAQGLLWVTGSGGKKWETPENQIVDGLLRGLRTENAMLKAVTLAVDNKTDTSHIAELTRDIFGAMVQKELTELEIEYREHDGALFINRVNEANSMNDWIHEATQPQVIATQPFGGSHLPPLALQFKTPGLLDSLQFVEDELAYEPLQPNQVEIEVRSVGVNFMDLLTALGRINQVEIGGECAGIITRLGSSVDSELRVGDRVCAVVFDCFKTLARGNAQTVVKIPDSLSFTEAAALPVTFTTAHYALMVAGRLARGDKVLIHAAAGGTGQSAIQIAQNAGAEVFATVGSLSKKQLLVDRYGVPEDHIFYSRDTSFTKGIMRMTEKRGVDVVLNSLAGDGLSASWACMASFGRFVEIGKRDIHSHSRLNMFYFAKNVSFTGVDVFGMTKERPGLVRQSLNAAMDLVGKGYAKPSYPLQVYPVSEIEKAFRHMQSGKSTGKLVIDMSKEAHILVSFSQANISSVKLTRRQTVLNRKPSYTFDPNATYVIAGGFGGIARRTARWMVDRGAKHLLLLSRSGPKSEAANTLVEELCRKGVQVCHPACDIASEDAIAGVLKEVAITMPTIKGCIQGAMVLKDAMLDKMTYNEWKQVLSPKVDGSRSLDRLLPSGLDFFIMLSSVVGIHGSAGQSNYAAGGTYQDALARHRVHRGERAIALDLGWMISDGIISESEFLTKTFQTTGLMMPINSTEYLALLEYYCNPMILDSRDQAACQVMIGLETPAALVAKGVDIPALMHRSTFQYMHAIGIDGSGKQGDLSVKSAAAAAKNWSVAFVNARSLVEAADVVVGGLVHKLTRALSIPAEDIDTMRPLHSYGVDSLLAVEIRSWFAKEFKSDVAVFEIMGGSNFAAVAKIVITKSKSKQATWEES
ncbi:hypothetical protein QQS21_001464 [Conoideocrella luteorostrata]|uniref:Polyketide synthase n=1 Tax=Conoideocrella luteorostrata TaxID=1105319 RepID=A0AAJ0G3E8_9HYPO|nr:hypothetical protein QQS21_001464 [Conoideocrella luteorostrata]